MWGNPEVTRFIDARGKLTQEDVEDLLLNEIKSDKKFNVQYWPIFLLKSNEHIGCCGVRPYDPSKKIYEIGAHILAAHWRNGFAMESSRSVIEHTFNVLNFSALFAGHNPNNRASKKLLEKLGFTYVRDEYYPPTGLNHPSYLLTQIDYVNWKQDMQ